MNHAKRVLWLVTALCEAYGQTLTDLLFELYKVALTGIEPKAMEEALPGLLRRDSGFMPKPGEVYAACGGRGTAEGYNPALLAWKTVRAAISKVGGYDSVIFADAAIGAAITDLGGWVRLCGLSSSDLDWKAKEFPKLYELASRMKLQSKVLAGIYSCDGEAPVNVRVIGISGFEDGELCIAEYRAPEKQKLLENSKPVSVESLAKRLEWKRCEPPEPVDAPAEKQRTSDPQMAAVADQLARNKALQALKRKVFLETTKP